ncbi:sodium:calcium antiporter [Kiritimatiella glycovorans]|uniref:Cation transporter n=1 Tax=Kiritimatiella glycovorans TaxID=1307763 RepID=A0A0G3EF14_9BACT|nr:sodium:calcium antiporter [Kiritimatiella glycovorans]AKJ63355.1 cation transporter [Kiritimatiella glycovorans]
MLNVAQWPMEAIVLLFAGAGAAIAVTGTRISGTADRLADVTGWGEAIFGAVLLGGSTSLSGLVTSVAAAAGGHPDLAISNAIGGIAVQTFFLAVADAVYRGVNLEHAAASLENLLQGALLIVLLALPLVFRSAPQSSIAGVHPGSIILAAAYLFGMRVVMRGRRQPMWRARRTEETREDPGGAGATSRTKRRLWIEFSVCAAVLLLAGMLIMRTGVEISERTGLSETFVGALLTAVVTSLPELITSVAAVRRGALTLAVGNIIGGNSFDMLFLAGADMAFRPGAIYAAMTSRHALLISVTILMTGVLLLGLLRREKRGIGNIGFESVLVLVIYVAAMIMLATG